EHQLAHHGTPQIGQAYRSRNRNAPQACERSTRQSAHHLSFANQAAEQVWRRTYIHLGVAFQIGRRRAAREAGRRILCTRNPVMLHEFLTANRDELIALCREKVAKRSSPLTPD